jgi:hypothetical protein
MSAPRGYDLEQTRVSWPHFPDDLEAFGAVRGYDYSLGDPRVARGSRAELSVPSGIETEEAPAAALLEAWGETRAPDAVGVLFDWPSEEEALAAERGTGLVTSSVTTTAGSRVLAPMDEVDEMDAIAAPRGADLSGRDLTPRFRISLMEVEADGAPRGHDLG